MADITLPVPGENPNWGSKLNTAILRINASTETNASDINTVEGQVVNIQGVVQGLGNSIAGIPDTVRDEVVKALSSNPAVIQAAIDAVSNSATLNQAVAQAIETLGISYDYNSPQYTLAHRDADGVFSQLRIRALDGKFPDDVALEMFRRGSALAGGTDTGGTGAPARGFSAFPIFTARMSKSAADQTPAALVYVGSSTTANYGVAASDGYVALLHAAIQSRWPSGGTESTVQVNASADFSRVTTPGVHGYNAGQGGTNAATYLTNAECDKIAALYPAAIFHMVGSNDFKAQDSPATYKARVESRLAYLDSVLTDPCQHILIHPYQRVDFTPSTYQWSEYATALREIAASRSNTKVVDISAAYAAVGIPGSDPLEILSADNVHMVKRGYRFMADLLADAVLS